MLYEIASPPTQENSVILLNPRDNVAIARVPLAPGQEAIAGARKIAARAAIPAGHKVALTEIAAGENVYRYGHVIGVAVAAIQAGDYVHTHNLGFQETGTRMPAAREERAGRATGPGATFRGYRRADGRVQLHRGGGGQQLRGAYGGTDRPEL